MNVAVATHLQWQQGAAGAEAQFFAEGMHCSNCAQSLRRGIGALPGIQHVDVNLATGRVSVAWDPARLVLDTVLETVTHLGFKPVPLSGEAAVAERQREQRTALKRIGLAGLATMQMSMYTVGLYAGAFTGIDPMLERLLKLASMLLAVPVLFYSGAPFLQGAFRDLKRRSLGMDVPVAVALILAFAASVFNTLRNSGQLYFDSVAMFIFFLLLGRYIEMRVRRGSLDASEALARSLPTHVTRRLANGATERIGLERVGAGDELLIAQGAIIPTDAALISESALVDEALTTGESLPVAHRSGDALMGGALNVGGAISVRARSDARSSTLSSMIGLMERAQSERPHLALAADRAAAGFVGAILALSVAVALLWLWIDPSRAFSAVLAVLVVTCPCALSLATPAAVAAATARLARRGILITRANTLEHLAQVDTIVLDKTGTLTEGHVELGPVQLHGARSAPQCLAIAAALEAHSSHPLAAAFRAHAAAGVRAREVHEVAGQGLEGWIGSECWRIGRAAFVAEVSQHPWAKREVYHSLDEFLWLGSADGPSASFELTDPLRPQAAGALSALRAAGLSVVIASGDRLSAVQRVASELHIAEAHGRLDPAGKISLVRKLQGAGHRVLMVGDGINDAPVLGAADVSCAMGHGAAVAHAAADMLLLNDSLQLIGEAVLTARANARLVRANLAWALGYNLCAVPLAAMGWVPPWVAAIGMSCSSLFVVWRAQRFARS
jgi:Cu2+-exporting ATPase